MSFTVDIKDELCRLPSVKPCCAAAECLGLLLYGTVLSPERVRLMPQSGAVRQRVATLFREVFGITPATPEGQPSVLEIESAGDIQKIYAAFGYDYKSAPLQLNLAVLEDECCKSAFLRGAFLTGGYVSFAGKGYHLELVTSHYHVARQLRALLLDLEMPAGLIQRRGNYVLYYKDSALIEDFLTACGASGSAMELMLQKVERDLRNKVNRKVNCETANLSKTVEAAARQIAAIHRLQQSGRLDELPAVLRETARIRLENPEMSLSELQELFTPPISRPGLSGRIRKLVKLSEELPL